MQFSPEQEKTLSAVSRWLKSKENNIFRLFGYAGTGKTTLARHLAENVDGEVQFATFTGKAAKVMQSKGNKNARTIHSLIYKIENEKELVDEKTGKRWIEPSFTLNLDSDIKKAKLVIIDECSMVDTKMGEDLLSFGIPILVLGDPAQLPPIRGSGFFTQHDPDILLTTIHRQARDNAIIRISADIRAGKRIGYGNFDDVSIIPKSQVNREEILKADQILVGINQTRKKFNGRIRDLKEFDDIYPQVGDRLICLRNNHNNGLLNGSQWLVDTIKKPEGKGYLSLYLNEEDEEKSKLKVKTLKACFEDRIEEVKWSEREKFDEFDYGYAITVHKSQGSQWDNVYLFDESFAFKENRTRWLYTAVTRAAKKITIVK